MVYFKQKSYSFKRNSASEIILFSFGAITLVLHLKTKYISSFREKQPRRVNILIHWLGILYAVSRKCLAIVFRKQTKNNPFLDHQHKFKCSENSYPHLIAQSSTN